MILPILSLQRVRKRMSKKKLPNQPGRNVADQMEASTCRDGRRSKSNPCRDDDDEPPLGGKFGKRDWFLVAPGA